MPADGETRFLVHQIQSKGEQVTLVSTVRHRGSASDVLCASILDPPLTFASGTGTQAVFVRFLDDRVTFCNPVFGLTVQDRHDLTNHPFRVEFPASAQRGGACLQPQTRASVLLRAGTGTAHQGRGGG